MGWVFLSPLLLVLCALGVLCILLFGIWCVWVCIVCVFVVVWCFLAFWEDWPVSHVLESSWKTLTRESCLLFCQETACAGCQCNEGCVLCAYRPVLASFHGGQQNWYLKSCCPYLLRSLQRRVYQDLVKWNIDMAGLHSFVDRSSAGLCASFVVFNGCRQPTNKFTMV